MKTLRCTCGQILAGETGAELYAAVEAHAAAHAKRAANRSPTPRQGAGKGVALQPVARVAAEPAKGRPKEET
jgi:hypothetical protein